MESNSSYWIVVALPCLAMILDTMSGFVAASYNNRVSSTEMRKGLWRKLAEVLAIAAAFLLEYSVQAFGSLVHVYANIPVNLFVCAYILVYEMVSILENIGKVDPQLGNWLVRTIGLDASTFEKNEDEGGE